MNPIGSLWTFKVETDGDGSLVSGVRGGELTIFVKKCNPKAKLTEANAEEWILQYIVEEKGYARNRIKSVEIST